MQSSVLDPSLQLDNPPGFNTARLPMTLKTGYMGLGDERLEARAMWMAGGEGVEEKRRRKS